MAGIPERDQGDRDFIAMLRKKIVSLSRGVMAGSTWEVAKRSGLTH